MLDMIESTDLLSLLEEFENIMQNQAKFLCNYIKMVKLLMLFVRATQESNWVLHLSSLDKFVKYFFVHDLHNYARYSPVYLADMFDLQTSDPTTWQFLADGYFSVNKTATAFSAIGADHALEQENRGMKGEMK